MTAPPVVDLDRYARSVLAEAAARFPLSREPGLEWSGRMTTTAGLALYRPWTIRLSSRVLDDAAKVRSTLLHEYAHLLAVDRDGLGAANHGPSWRRAMRDLGQEPSVRHDYAVERRIARRRVVYRCAGCGAEIVRARRLARGRRWVHTPCGGALRLTRVEEC
mgnify:CR=1 FL=1